MNHPIGPDAPTFEVAGRLNLNGNAEFLGIRHRPDGMPVATLRVMGVDVDFTELHEADAFAAAATILANQLHIAHDRNAVQGQHSRRSA